MSAVIVVHGVGNQTRGSSGAALASALGNALSRDTQLTPPVVRRHEGEVLSLVPGLVGPPEPEFVTCSERHALEWTTVGTMPGRTTVYEFYWADESRGGTGVKGFAHQLWSYWQLMAGLPRLGLHSLDELKGFLPHAMRFLYSSAWILLVLRLVLHLGFLLLHYLLGVRESWLFRMSFFLDVPIALFTLLFLIALVSWKCSRKPAARSVRAQPLLIALATASFLTTIIPIGFEQALPARPPVPATMTEVLATTIVMAPAAPPAALSALVYSAAAKDAESEWILKLGRFSFDLRSLYARTTLAGFSRFVSDFLAVGMIGALAVVYGCARMYHWKRGTGDIGWFARPALFAGKVLWIFVLVVSPMLDLITVGYPLLSGSSLKPLFPDNGEVADWIIFVTNLAVLPYAFIIGSVILVANWRATMTVVVAFAVDLINYLPPRPFLDRCRALRFFLGGRRGPRHSCSLDEELQLRLRNLVALAHRLHGGPVIMVAHSLGSMISLSALHGWTAPPFVRLVTMGSPALLMVWAYPSQKAAGFPFCGPWNFPALIDWHNYYRSADLVGRDLAPAVSFAPANVVPTGGLLSAGGHLDYFSDRQVAEKIRDLV